MKMAEGSRPDSRRWFVMVVVAGALCAAPIGCSTRVETARTPPPPVVTVVEARKSPVPIQASTTGTTRALQEVSIRARVKGFLKERHFKEGTEVKAGQLLFVIEEDPFQARLDSAKAQLAEAEATVKKAEQSKSREVALAQVAIDQAMLTLAQVEERREQALLKRNAATIEDVDRKVAIRKKDEAQLQADRASQEQAKADYETNLETARANVKAAEAAVREAALELSYCRMSAPIDGRIGEAKVKLGNLVGPSAGGQEYTELATIQELDPLGVDVRVSSRYLARASELLRGGLTARLVRPDFDGEKVHPYPGKAFFIDNAVDPTTSTFLMKFEFPNPQRTLLPGEYVKLDMTIGAIPNAIVVPEQAVMETQGGSIVYVIDREEKVAVARVKAGSTSEGMRVIESGLEPGQKIIVEGLQLVRAGMKVRAEPGPPPASPVAATPGVVKAPPGGPSQTDVATGGS